METNLNSQKAVVTDMKSDTSAQRTKTSRKIRRTAGGALALTIGLTGAGVLANALTPDAQVAVAENDSAALVAEGKDIYDTACVTCHGANLSGVKGRGPSLIGVGEGAAYFQVNSGRMPMLSNDAQAERKHSRYSDNQVLAIAAYVASMGGGPELVRNEDGSVAMKELRGSNYNGKIDPADVASGSELFRLNCASCHNFTGRGGALSSGKYAPNLDPASEQEIYQAMLSGPQNMPRFSERQLSADQKKDIIAFIKAARETPTPGGFNLYGLGPVAEGTFFWLFGITVVIALTMWIGSRS